MFENLRNRFRRGSTQAESEASAQLPEVVREDPLYLVESEYPLYQLVNAPGKKVGAASGESRKLDDGIQEHDTLAFYITDEGVTGVIMTDIFHCRDSFCASVGSRKTAMEFPEGAVFELTEPYDSGEQYESAFSPVETFKTGRSRVIISHEPANEVPLLRVSIPLPANE